MCTNPKLREVGVYGDPTVARNSADKLSWEEGQATVGAA